MRWRARGHRLVTARRAHGPSPPPPPGRPAPSRAGRPASSQRRRHAEPLRHHLDRLACAEHHRRGRVPSIVQANRRRASCCHRFVPPPSDRLRVRRLAEFVNEHETPIDPRRAGLEPLDRLTLPPRRESRDRAVVERHDPRGRLRPRPVAGCEGLVASPGTARCGRRAANGAPTLRRAWSGPRGRTARARRAAIRSAVRSGPGGTCHRVLLKRSDVYDTDFNPVVDDARHDEPALDRPEVAPGAVPLAH